ADGDGVELGDRGERAGAADLDANAPDPGLGLLGGELVGDRPTRRPPGEAKAALIVDPVDLDDDAVDVVGQAEALLGDPPIVGAQGRFLAALLRERIDLKAVAAQRREEGAVATAD